MQIEAIKTESRRVLYEVDDKWPIDCIGSICEARKYLEEAINHCGENTFFEKENSVIEKTITIDGKVIYGKNKETEWISTNDHLPNDDREVLAVTDTGSIFILHGLNDIGAIEYYFDQTGSRITYWKSLPDVPEGFGHA